MIVNNYNVIDTRKKTNQSLVSIADREIPTLGSPDNARNLVNLVSSIIHLPSAWDFWSASETDDRFCLSQLLHLKSTVSPFLLKFLLVRNPGSSKWVKRQPTDLAVGSSSPTQGKIFSTLNGVPLHTAFHYQPVIIMI